MSQSVVIYSLKDQTGVRYVGVTSRSPNVRARELMNAAHSESSRMEPAVRSWLLKLQAAGEQPVVKSLKVVPAEEGFSRETDYIQSFILQGQPILNRPHENGVLGELPEREKICHFCGNEFTTRSHKAKWCSRACQQKAWREKWGVIHSGRNVYVKTRDNI